MFRLTLAAGAAAVAALLVAAGAGPALAAGWTVVPAPPTGQGGFVTGISAPTATDAWAVVDSGTGSFTGAFTDHWNGTAWSQVPVPSFPCTGDRCYVHLFSVSASATDAWALGVYSPKPGYKTCFTLDWNGSAWTASDGLLGASVAAGSSNSGTSASSKSPHPAERLTGRPGTGRPHLHDARSRGGEASWDGTSPLTTDLVAQALAAATVPCRPR